MKNVQPKVSVHICELLKIRADRETLWPLLSDRLTELKHESPASFLCTASRNIAERERKSGQILFSLKGCGSSSFLSFAIINRSRRRNSTSSSSSLQSHAAEESLKVQSYLFIPKRSIAEKREFAVHVLRMEWNRNFERILLF